MKKILASLLFVAMAALSGCGAGSSAVSSLVSGTASQGAALPAGTVVTLKDAKGVKVTSSVTDDKGSFKVTVDGLTAPFVLKAGNFFSLASAAGTTNVNPLTDLSMKLALGTSTLDDSTVIPANFTTKFASVTADLKSKIDGLFPATVTATKKDFLNGAITIDDGVDKVFESLAITEDTPGHFSASVGGTQIFSTTRANDDSTSITVDDNAISSIRETIFPSATVPGAGGATTVSPASVTGNWKLTLTVTSTSCPNLVAVGAVQSVNMTLSATADNLLKWTFFGGLHGFSTSTPLTGSLSSAGLFTATQSIPLSASDTGYVATFNAVVGADSANMSGTIVKTGNPVTSTTPQGIPGECSETDTFTAVKQ